MRRFLILSLCLVAAQTPPERGFFPRHLAPKSAAQSGPALFDRLYLDYGREQVAARESSRDAWGNHISRSQVHILYTAARTRNKQRALILGVGNGFEIPLHALEALFEEITVVDLDENALASIRQRHSRARTVKGDLTGGAILDLLRRVELWIGRGWNMEAVDRNLAEALRRLKPAPILFGAADLVVSSAVACQIHTFLFNGIDWLVRGRLGLPFLPETDAVKDRVKETLRRQHLQTLRLNLNPGGAIYFSYTWPSEYQILEEDVDQFRAYPMGSATDAEFLELLPGYFDPLREETWKWPIGNPETGPINVFRVRGMALRPSPVESSL